MTKWRTAVLLVGAAMVLAGCSSRGGSGGAVSGAMRDFLRRFGSLNPAEAVVIAVRIHRGPHDLAVQRAAARREAVLLTPKELQAPLPPPDRNAALLYSRLTRLLQKKPLDPKTDRIRGSLGVRVAHSPEEVARVRRLLIERQDVMELVQAAAARPECVFRRHWERGFLMQFPEYRTMREAARLLTARSYFQAQGGHYAEAVASETLALRLAQHPTGDPCAIGQLVGIACNAIALAGMENILCTAGPNAPVDEAVYHAVADHRLRLQLRRALEGEITIYSTSMQGLRQSEGAANGNLRPTGRPGDPGSAAVPPDLAKTAQGLPPAGRQIWAHCLDAGEADYLSLMRSLIAASGEPYVRSRALVRRLRELNSDTAGNPVLQLASPAAVLGDMLTHSTHVRAQEEALKTSAEVLAYAARHGAFPDRLEQAISRPPLDPFGSHPLQYRREANGFVIYSVGPDGDFDGSQPGARRARNQAYFRYPATPLPARD